MLCREGGRIRDRSRVRRIGLILVLAIGLFFVLTKCVHTPPDSIAGNVDHVAAVVSVNVHQQDSSDHGIPFARIPNDVLVVMDRDASADEVVAVFAALERDIDDGDVGYVEINLLDDDRVVLATGSGVQGSEAMARDLLWARDNDDIKRYRRDSYPVLPSVDVILESPDLGAAKALVDRYRDDEEIESISVVAGSFLLIRDIGNDPPEAYDQRVSLLVRVADLFELIGGSATNGSPLHLCVKKQDRAALERYLSTDPEALALGRVVVRTDVRRRSCWTV